MIVKFRGFTFTTNWAESVVKGAPSNRVKLSHYPGVKGAISMNMRQAERHIMQSGTLRVSTQAQIISLQGQVESLCDGTRGDADGLSAHGEMLTTVYADTVNWGTQFKATGGIQGDYFGVPYTIDYIQPNP